MWIFALDSLLLISLLFLLAPRLTGLPVHEWLGICSIVPIAFHLLLSSRWVANTLSRFRTAQLRTRINFCLNAGLLLLILLELVSGVVISRVVVPALGFVVVEDRVWRSLHNQGLNFLVLLLGVHLAMNWPWLIGAARRRWRGASFATRPSVGQVSRFAAGLVIMSVVIAALAWTTLGTPSPKREYRQNEIARFEPTVAHGLVQFGGEAMLVGVVAFAARKWLRVRL